LLQINEDSLAPKSQAETTILVELYAAGLKTLVEGKFSRSDDAKQAVAQSCVDLVKSQRKELLPLNVPSSEKLIAAYRPQLPALKWEETLKQHEPKIAKLVDQISLELKNSNLKGPVSEAETNAVLRYIKTIEGLSKKGDIDTDTSVIAIRRLVQSQRTGEESFLHSVPEGTMRRCYFEAVIEKGLPLEDSTKKEAVIALLSSIKGIETTPVTFEGQKRLQLLGNQLISSSFAGGRSLDHFRVVHKVPVILLSMGLSTIRDLNEYKLAPHLLVEIFDQNQLYVFKNQNLREILDGISNDPIQAFSAIIEPMVAVIATEDKEIKQKTNAIVASLMQGQGLEATQSLIKQIGGSLGGIEVDLKVSTEGLISGLLSIVQESKKDELELHLHDLSKKQDPDEKVSLVQESKKNELEPDEIVLLVQESKKNELEPDEKVSSIKAFFREVTSEISIGQLQRENGVAVRDRSPAAIFLDELKTVKLPSWLIDILENKAQSAAKKILNSTMGAKLTKVIVVETMNHGLAETMKRNEKQIKILESLSESVNVDAVLKEVSALEKKKKLKTEDRQHLNFLYLTLAMNPEKRSEKLTDLKMRQELLGNIKGAVPEIVSVGMEIALNVLEKGNLSKHKELIDYILQLAKHPEQPVDQQKLMELLYKSTEAILDDSRTIFPGLFEGALNGLKSIANPIPAAHISQPNIILDSKAAVKQFTAEDVSRAKAFPRLIAAAYESSFWDSDTAAKMKTGVKQLIPKMNSEFLNLHPRHVFTADEIKEVGYLAEIGITLMHLGYKDTEVALALKRYCEDQIEIGKEIKAPDWNHLIGSIEYEQYQVFLPYLFDAAVATLTAEVINEGKSRQLPDGTKEESYLDQKVRLLINSKHMESQEAALNPNGRAILKEIISGMFDAEFAAGQQLTNPVLLHRFPLILDGAGLSDVSALNAAKLDGVKKSLISEGNVFLGKINPLLIGKSIIAEPQKSVEILVSPILDTLMEGSPVEKRKAKSAVSNLFKSITGAPLANQMIGSIEKQLGPILSLEGISLDIDISTHQALDGLRSSNEKLKAGLKKGKVSTEEAAGYGFLSSMLMKFVNNVANAQEQRSGVILESQIDHGAQTSKMADMLDYLGTFTGKAVFRLLSVGMDNMDILLPLLKPVIAFGMELYLKGKIENLEGKVVRNQANEDLYIILKNKSLLTKEENIQLQEFEKNTCSAAEADQLELFKALYENREELLNLLTNVLVAFSKKHKISDHSDLINYIRELANNPDKKVNEQELMGHVLKSFDILLNQAETYDELIPRVLGALAKLGSPAT